MCARFACYPVASLYLICGAAEITEEFGRFDWAVAIGMGLLTFLTFSLDKPLLFGFWAYQCKSMWSGQKTNWYLLSAAVALSVAVVAQHLQTP